MIKIVLNNSYSAVNFLLFAKTSLDQFKKNLSNVYPVGIFVQIRFEPIFTPLAMHWLKCFVCITIKLHHDHRQLTPPSICANWLTNTDIIQKR